MVGVSARARRGDEWRNGRCSFFVGAQQTGPPGRRNDRAPEASARGAREIKRAWGISRARQSSLARSSHLSGSRPAAVNLRNPTLCWQYGPPGVGRSHLASGRDQRYIAAHHFSRRAGPYRRKAQGNVFLAMVTARPGSLESPNRVSRSAAGDYHQKRLVPSRHRTLAAGYFYRRHRGSAKFKK